MKYNFESLVDRSRAGSVKWNMMRTIDPEVPAGIVPLSIGDMELKNPPEIIDGLKQYLEETILGYTEPTHKDTQATIDWFAKRHSWYIEPDWIIPFDGVVPALYLLVQTFSNPGDKIVFMPPVYRPLYYAIDDTGRTPVEVPLTIDNAAYAMDFELLEKTLRTEKPKMLLFCSPHNPVSRVWRRDELLRLGTLCRDNNVLVVSDEIHMDFAMPGHKHLVFSEIDPSFTANSVICTAPSKTFNIAGLQVSNIIIPDADLRKRFATAYENTGRFGPNQLGIAACRIAYEQCAPWLDAVLELIHSNGEMVRSFMSTHYPIIPVFPHEGTYFIWLDFRSWRKSSDELERFFTRAARLFLDEGPIFGPQGNGFERINLACPPWLLHDSLARLLPLARP